MNVNAVQIKVIIDGAQVDRGLEAFDLGPNGQQRSVYFCEDVTSNVSSSTLLLDFGVILRVCEKCGKGTDSTIKLRPCRRSQLTNHWLDGAERAGLVKLEADWFGTRKVLAAACTRRWPDGNITKVRAGDTALTSLFSAKQKRFLRDCAGIRVNLDVLTLLGPVAVTRWKLFRIGPPDAEFDLVAERWVIDDALEELVCRRELQLDPNQDAKTRGALTYTSRRTLVNNLAQMSSQA